MERSSSRPGSRSRRSYPSLNQISLTPLTPRYPIDDDGDDDNHDEESQAYYSAPPESPDRLYSAHDRTPSSSYLSSFSVPGTPGVLSQSRSGSRTRHGRSKSSTRTSVNSDVRRQSQDGKGTPRSVSSRHQPSKSAGGHPDSEWMLRTGITLASSTREEKGQSWLVKRESSTSLASDANHHETHPPSGPRGSKGASQKSRSGMSTPSGFSRRGSRSYALSRRNSRPDLSMSGLEMTSHSWVATPAGDAEDFSPDDVGERIRAEMALMQQELDEYASSSDESFDSADEIDEKELQRLTRERGFGLGSWLDRMVEWTLFGVDEWPPNTDADGPVDPPSHSDDQTPGHQSASRRQSDNSMVEDNDSISDKNDDEYTATMMERPGESGGWEDATWLLRAIKRALL